MTTRGNDSGKASPRRTGSIDRSAHTAQPRDRSIDRLTGRSISGISTDTAAEEHCTMYINIWRRRYRRPRNCSVTVGCIISHLRFSSAPLIPRPVLARYHAGTRPMGLLLFLFFFCSTYWKSDERAPGDESERRDSSERRSREVKLANDIADVEMAPREIARD